MELFINERTWNKYAKTIAIPEDRKAALPNYESMLDTDNASTYNIASFGSFFASL